MRSRSIPGVPVDLRDDRKSLDYVKATSGPFMMHIVCGLVPEFRSGVIA